MKPLVRNNHFEVYYRICLIKVEVSGAEFEILTMNYNRFDCMLNYGKIAISSSSL